MLGHMEHGVCLDRNVECMQVKKKPHMCYAAHIGLTRSVCILYIVLRSVRTIRKNVLTAGPYCSSYIATAGPICFYEVLYGLLFVMMF